MDPREVKRQRVALGQGITNAAAERVDQVFFGMAVGLAVSCSEI
jgi:hypothetical protein